MTNWIGDRFHADPWIVIAAGGVLALILLLVVVKQVQKLLAERRALLEEIGEPEQKRPLSVVMLSVAAVLATGVSGDTAWRFVGSELGITNEFERAFLFGVGEIALFSLALAARTNLRNPEKNRTGAPGIAVWMVSAFLAVPAFTESASLPAALFRTVMGPLASAFLWHLAMGIELRQANPKARDNGLWALLVGQMRERTLARLGLVERDRDADQIARDRATVKAAALTEKYEAQLKNGKGGKEGMRSRRTARRMQKQFRKAGVATIQAQRDQLLALRAVSQHTRGLVDVQLDSPWTTSAPAVTVQATEADSLPASNGPKVSLTKTVDLDEEWKRIAEATKDDDGDNPDDDPKGPGGAPLPEQASGDAEAIANATVWAREEKPETMPEPEPVLSEAEVHAKALEPLNNADAIRYAIRETGSAVAGQLVRWLAEHGKQGVNEGQAYRVAKKHFDEQRRSNIRPLRPTTGA